MLSGCNKRDDGLKSLLATLPGFKDYQERFPNLDFESLLNKYELSLQQSNKLTFGISASLKLVKRKYSESKNSQEKGEGHRAIPAWASLMTSEEYDNFNSLICRLPSLSLFLQDYSSNPNFTEAICLFEEKHMKELRQQRSMRYLIDSIKKCFQDIMEKRVGALHYVSTEHSINDKDILQDLSDQLLCDLVQRGVGRSKKGKCSPVIHVFFPRLRVSVECLPIFSGLFPRASCDCNPKRRFFRSSRLPQTAIIVDRECVIHHPDISNISLAMRRCSKTLRG